jgi:hypothetical protein
LILKGFAVEEETTVFVEADYVGVPVSGRWRSGWGGLRWVVGLSGGRGGDGRSLGGGLCSVVEVRSFAALRMTSGVGGCGGRWGGGGGRSGSLTRFRKRRDWVPFGCAPFEAQGKRGKQGRRDDSGGLRGGWQRAGLSDQVGLQRLRKTGHYLFDEFGARARHWSAGLRLWLRGLGCGDGVRSFAALRMTNRLGGSGGPSRLPSRLRASGASGWEAVVVVIVDGIADGIAPAFGAEGVDVFVLGEVDGLHESLGEIGDGAGGSGLYIAADDGGDET